MVIIIIVLLFVLILTGLIFSVLSTTAYYKIRKKKSRHNKGVSFVDGLDKSVVWTSRTHIVGAATNPVYDNGKEVIIKN